MTQTKIMNSGCHRMQRRHFLKAGAALMALDRFPHHLYAGTRKSAQDRILLGPAKVPVSRLAMGTGTNGTGGSSNQTKKLGFHGVSELFRAAADQGVFFWDSADQYGSHPHLKEALKTVPREKVTIMSKSRALTAADMRADLDRFRREIGTDYIDIVLMHCMIDDDWDQRYKGAMDVLSEAKEKGWIRTKGTSCHTLGALKTAAKSPWVEVDLARFNPAGVAMDDKPEVVAGVLKEMKAAGKGIIGMKVLGAGKLRTKADEALQWHLGQQLTDCFTIGSESRAEMEDLLRKIPAASTRG
ncbi:aldo/keto reductase [Bryobacter aggregatus]|uniref:aldo/keto reductase n=1 Tax=Bryobacter aggregatus TaxID=360054 RepID=UPI00192E3952|nr:aldo/keto reductase [Bryobacter aggregatus]